MKLYKKIDLFYQGDYVCSTMQSKTCREAKERYLDACKRFPNLVVHKVILKNPKDLRARFDRGAK